MFILITLDLGLSESGDPGGVLSTNKMVLTAIHQALRANLVSLSVFYETTSVTVVKELPKYTPDSILSSLGGALSLYLGISIISLFETWQLGFNLLASQGSTWFKSGDT